MIFLGMVEPPPRPDGGFRYRNDFPELARLGAAAPDRGAG